MRWLRLLAGTTCLFLSLGVLAATDEEAQRQIADLRRQLYNANAQIDARMIKIENAIRGQGIMDMANHVELLKNDVAALRGQVEMLLHQTEQNEKRQKDFYVDLDTRLRRLEQAASERVSAATLPAPTAAASAEPAPPAPSSEGGTSESRVPAASATAELSAESVYSAARSQLQNGSYQSAIAGFENFLKTYPSSHLAPNARYWIGFCYQTLRDYRLAIASFEEVVKRWPDSEKAPDAMLSMAKSQIDKGERLAGRKTYETLIARYPGTTAMETAKQRLARMK